MTELTAPPVARGPHPRTDDPLVISIRGAGHYLQVIDDGDVLPSLNDRLDLVCREKFRRIDRFIQLALLGSAECVRGRALAPDCALYICSGSGPVGTNIAVQEAIVGSRVLPTPFHFVNTLGSSAGFYVARNLSLAGQSLFISRRGDNFSAGLACVATDLAAGAVSQALLGFVEECSLPLSAHRSRQLLPADALVAEGSHWLLLERFRRDGTHVAVHVPQEAGAGRHDSTDAAQVTALALNAPAGTFGFAPGGSGAWNLVRLGADG